MLLEFITEVSSLLVLPLGVPPITEPLPKAILCLFKDAFLLLGVLQVNAFFKLKSVAF
jgi:hypothetical protein